ncbi:MAG TPA: hypothetical protein VK074_05560 [Fodinibius sp.]|nr:hypothetical protein [Fodinibius sp.]
MPDEKISTDPVDISATDDQETVLALKEIINSTGIHSRKATGCDM